MPDLLDAPPPTPAPAAPALRERPVGVSTPEPVPPPESPRPLRVTVEMYHAMIGAGVFDGIGGRRIELLDEELVEMSPAYAPQEFHVGLAADVLRELIPSGWSVREEKSIVMPRSEPEPDVAVLKKASKFFYSRKPRPDEVALVVEVSDSTLHHDRTRKAAIYATAGISPYWIVNLPERVLEVRTDPHGETYRSLRTYGEEETIEFALDGRAFSLPVAELLPEAETDDG
ncbi:Uma2 family endonuclease [Alienimonas californiensis]|uniref:Putative restriction endonuclease domain-containing protein n=1 Tax=Alienimonas californiensis TaxID=2527989 RepID=A0A517P892_9PLAN|nr:Uma2 family endonuclease [Alienimonas californiensis]QDT15594.1 hypothetical protein CA12_16790 [Alienimonas californiensis]